MSDFNLAALVRADLDSSPVADPHIVAEHVLKQIAPRERETALAQCLPLFVRTVVTQSRGAAAQVFRDAHTAPGAAPQSRRWNAVKELGQRFHTPDGWKFLRDCTRDDLLGIAAERRSLAAANLDKAERFEALAALVAKRKADTVGDLPEDEVAAVLG